MNTTYFVCGGRDDFWIRTKAKTLAGAKRVAAKIYQVTFAGKIEIGISHNSCEYEMGKSVQTIAIRDGFNNWRTNY